MGEKTEQWAIVELFGHTKVAGLISECTMGGCSFVRVDVPPVEGAQGFTRLLGNGAIYAINFVDEAIARHVAKHIMAKPVQVYEMPQIESKDERPYWAESDEDAGE